MRAKHTLLGLRSGLAPALGVSTPFEQCPWLDIEDVAEGFEQLCVEVADPALVAGQPVQRRSAKPPFGSLRKRVCRSVVLLKDFWEAETHRFE